MAVYLTISRKTITINFIITEIQTSYYRLIHVIVHSGFYTVLSAATDTSSENKSIRPLINEEISLDLN